MHLISARYLNLIKYVGSLSPSPPQTHPVPFTLGRQLLCVWGGAPSRPGRPVRPADLVCCLVIGGKVSVWISGAVRV